MKFEPVSFIWLVESAFGIRLYRIDGIWMRICGRSRILDETVRETLRRYKSAILPYLPPAEDHHNEGR